MCGIVGYTGFCAAAPRLLAGLEKLAYRGYDSAGLAVCEGGEIKRARAEGKLEQLLTLTQGGTVFRGTCGIGHTRWATHGTPLVINAHPHMSADRRVAVVHNGIIENYRALREELLALGYEFASETDTEVIPHLIHRYFRELGSPGEAIRMTVTRLSGAFALGILFADTPDRIWAVRRQSPLVVARCGDGSLLASDVPAILDQTRQVVYPDEEELVCLSPEEIRFWDPQGRRRAHPYTTVTWDAAAARKDGYSSFMEKELHEVPAAVKRTHTAAVNSAGQCVDLGCVLDPTRLREAEELCFLGCGSAYHVGVSAQYLGEELLGIPVRVEPASEFRYRHMPLGERCLAVAVSQSGETADTLAALQEAKRRGIYVVGIVNVVGSAIAREADAVFYTQAGPEIAVATTKAYCAQMCAVYLLYAAMLRARGREREAAALEEAVKRLPDCLGAVLARRENLAVHASRIAQAQDVFFIGRASDYAACMEGALKLKEITYLHAEAYPAGELKHGTISLIEPGVPVVAVLTQGAVATKTLSGADEVRARGARVLVLASEGISLPPEWDACVRLPVPSSETAPLVATFAMQLLAFQVCSELGIDPDQPRNLAKSVTVE